MWRGVRGTRWYTWPRDLLPGEVGLTCLLCRVWDRFGPGRLVYAAGPQGGGVRVGCVVGRFVGRPVVVPEEGQVVVGVVVGCSVVVAPVLRLGRGDPVPVVVDRFQPPVVAVGARCLEQSCAEDLGLLP